MVEGPQQTKQDEQYPLLKVDGGGDVRVNPQPAPTLVTPGWGVAYAHKQSWISRWPEYISACWMTLILLGISFLVFYALGMEAYRRQPVLLVRCKGAKPASELFYHQIIPRGNIVPIMLYADYLTNMAQQYPMLHLHVYFLIDDSFTTSYRVRHPRFINTFVPMPMAGTYQMYKLNDANNKDLAEFQRKNPNINVTVMPLSKYMAMTPLKYKWRNIPLPYVTFYARVFSVWQYGGVGMDLSTFNNYFSNKQYLDRRIVAILRQHNDGIKPEDYTNTLNRIDREEETELFSLFHTIINSLWNETRTFFTTNLFAAIPEKHVSLKNEPLIRTHRNKREIPTAEPNGSNNTDNNSSIHIETIYSANATDLTKNQYETFVDNDVNKNFTNTVYENFSFNIENATNLNKTVINNNGTSNKTDIPKLVLFYDFAVISDNAVPSLAVPGALMQSDNNKNIAKRDNKPMKYDGIPTSPSYLLSLDAEGLFIAASARLHPFLSHLITAGCQRMHPKFAIQDTILTQCSGISREDPYCNNIYLL